MKSLLTVLVIIINIALESIAQSDKSKTFYTSGISKLNSKDFIQAIAAFTSAIGLKPDFADAYYQRARAKKLLAESVGFHNNEPCYDLVEALTFGNTAAFTMLESECMSECFHLKSAFFEPEIVFCADFSSKILYGLPENSKKMINILKLNLYNNKLAQFPEAISNFKNLIFMDISSNKLTSLSQAIGNNTKLKGLNLNKNQLTTLPDGIGKLKHLQHLFLRNNNLKNIPAAIGNLHSLVELDLAFNELTSMPGEIVTLKKLTTLNLVGNPLNHVEKKKIKDSLPGCTIYF
ncbi:MAG: leucine-rich repeat domain-containing protein [Bacteroidetes bacterium]|nr:leucine-rich repeat domain-containing protein [Bacteroidota bacterium]